MAKPCGGSAVLSRRKAGSELSQTQIEKIVVIGDAAAGPTEECTEASMTAT